MRRKGVRGPRKFFPPKAAGTGDDPQYDIMDKILRETQPEEALLVRTTFQGTRMHPDMRGSIEGISEENFTPAALINGVLRGMARELYDMYREFSEQVKLEAPVWLLPAMESERIHGCGRRLRRYLRKNWRCPLTWKKQPAERR